MTPSTLAALRRGLLPKGGGTHDYEYSYRPSNLRQIPHAGHHVRHLRPLPLGLHRAEPGTLLLRPRRTAGERGDYPRQRARRPPSGLGVGAGNARRVRRPKFNPCLSTAPSRFSFTPFATPARTTCSACSTGSPCSAITASSSPATTGTARLISGACWTTSA